MNVTKHLLYIRRSSLRRSVHAVLTPILQRVTQTNRSFTHQPVRWRLCQTFLIIHSGKMTTVNHIRRWQLYTPIHWSWKRYHINGTALNFDKSAVTFEHRLEKTEHVHYKQPRRTFYWRTVRQRYEKQCQQGKCEARYTYRIVLVEYFHKWWRPELLSYAVCGDAYRIDHARQWRFCLRQEG